MGRDDRDSTVAMARKHAVVLAGLTMALLAMAVAVGGSIEHRALRATSVVASTMTP
jgi:hypothetical protein